MDPSRSPSPTPSPESDVEETLHVASQQLRDFLPTLVAPLGIATEMLSKCMDFIEQQRLKGGAVEERHIQEFGLRQNSLIELFTVCTSLINQIFTFSRSLNRDILESHVRLQSMARESEANQEGVIEYKAKFDLLIQQINDLKDDVVRTYRI